MPVISSCLAKQHKFSGVEEQWYSFLLSFAALIVDWAQQCSPPSGSPVQLLSRNVNTEVFCLPLFGDGCWLLAVSSAGAVCLNTCTWPLQVTWASSQHRTCIPRVRISFQSKTENQADTICSFLALPSEVKANHFQFILLRPTPFQGEENRLHKTTTIQIMARKLFNR